MRTFFTGSPDASSQSCAMRQNRIDPSGRGGEHSRRAAARSFRVLFLFSFITSPSQPTRPMLSRLLVCATAKTQNKISFNYVSKVKRKDFQVDSPLTPAQAGKHRIFGNPVCLGPLASRGI